MTTTIVDQTNHDSSLVHSLPWNGFVFHLTSEKAAFHDVYSAGKTPVGQLQRVFVQCDRALQLHPVFGCRASAKFAGLTFEYSGFQTRLAGTPNGMLSDGSSFVFSF